MEMVRGLLVDVDVARPGRDEGDAVRDVRSGEWDDAFVDRLRPGLVAPEADKGEVGPSSSCPPPCFPLFSG